MFKKIFALLLICVPVLAMCSGCSMRDVRKMFESQEVSTGLKFKNPLDGVPSTPDLKEGANHIAGKYGVGIGSGSAKLSPMQRNAMRQDGIAY